VKATKKRPDHGHKITNYYPQHQDWMCLWKLKIRKVLSHLTSPVSDEELRLAILAAGREWSSLPETIHHDTSYWADRGYSMADAIAYFRLRLAHFSP
jgi:hypothetical protein